MQIVDQLKAIVYQQRQEIGRLKGLKTDIQGRLENLQRIISDRLQTPISDYYLVFNEKDGKYIKPLIVKADGIEEALMPENQRYFRELVMPIPAPSFFKEL